MKKTKRSLLAATSLFMVAILATTTATYAWFKNVSSATTNISMNVQSGDGLQIAAGATEYNTTVGWGYSLNANALGISDDKWTDLSTTNETLPTFIVDGTWNGDTTTYATGTAVNCKVRFKAKSAGTIHMSGTGTLASTNATANTFDSSLRVATKCDATKKIFANAATSNDAAIAAVAGTTGNQTPVVFNNANEEIATLAYNTASGYYVAEVDFYFWVEGTDAGCSDDFVNAATTAAANMNFGFVAA